MNLPARRRERDLVSDRVEGYDMNLARTLVISVIALAAVASGGSASEFRTAPDPAQDVAVAPDSTVQTAVFAGGCFWCTEAVFEQLAGVTDVVSGYAGGTAEQATYPAVSSGATDHAESIRVTYDPHRITYGKLLNVFFTVAHDPTQLNRQGPDSGRQYRSAIFYDRDEQKQVAAAYMRQLEKARLFNQSFATTLEPLDEFFPAEANHQDFVRRHPTHPYVRRYADPKVRKVRKHFASEANAQTKDEP